MDRKLINIKSTVNKQGETVSQIIHFKGGIKRTYHGILSETIKQGQFTKMMCEDGTLLMINDENVLCIEVIKEKE